MSFDPSPKVQDLQRRLAAFIDEHIDPNERRHMEEAESPGALKVLPVIDELKPKARSMLAPEVFDCNAPDTGNMEVLALPKYRQEPRREGQR